MLRALQHSPFALSLSKGGLGPSTLLRTGFDKLSPNGVRLLSPNGVGLLSLSGTNHG